MTSSPREALVLAGGLGTRLRAAVPERPKVVAGVAGRPFVAWILDQIERAGFERAVLATGHRAGEVEAAVGRRHGRLEIVSCREPEPLGTGGAIAHAVRNGHLRGDLAVVLNGDSYTGVDLAHVVRSAAETPRWGTIVLVEVDDVTRFGRVVRRADGTIARFEEKSGARGKGWINAGIYALPAAWFGEVPAGVPVSLERDLLPRWVERGLVAYPSGAAFIDIGTPESWVRAQAMFEAEFA